MAPARPGGLGTAAYLVGMVYNELPVVAMVLVLATTLPGLDGSDLTTPLGLVATTLRVATLAGLVVVLRRAVRSGGVQERAMTAALGPNWRSVIDPELAAGLRRQVPLCVPCCCRSCAVASMSSGSRPP